MRLILRAHMARTQKMVINSLDKRWQTWSTQATELQLLRANREKWKKQGITFFKMDDETITTDLEFDMRYIRAYCKPLGGDYTIDEGIRCP